MNTREHQHESAFVLILYVILFGVRQMLPGKYGGGVAMLVVSIIGLAIYIVLFRKGLAWKRATLYFIGALALAAGIAIGLLTVVRGHWP